MVAVECAVVGAEMVVVETPRRAVVKEVEVEKKEVAVAVGGGMNVNKSINCWIEKNASIRPCVLQKEEND